MVAVITADLLDADPEVRAALAEAHVVYHLAGCPDVRGGGYARSKLLVERLCQGRARPEGR